MRIAFGLIIAMGLFAVSGCLDFGDDKEKTKLTKKELEDCRKRMYLKKSLKIEPLGYFYRGSGIDHAIFFKFRTDAQKPEDIFDTKTVDVSKFKDGFIFLNSMKKLKWWDTKGKKLFGGQVELPSVKYMKVGMEKDEKGYVVYIMWFEV